MMGRRKSEVIKTFTLTLAAILVMFVILFPVYYIFTVSISPQGSIATTHLNLIPKNVTLEPYREVLFGLGGQRISENFTGILEGNAVLENGKLYMKDGTLSGRVKYGPFTGIEFSVPVKDIQFTVPANQKTSGQLTAKVHGLFILTRIGQKNTIGFGIIRNVIMTSGKIDGTPVSGPMVRYVVIMNKGRVTLTTVGKFVNSVFFGYLKNSIILATLTVVLSLIFVIPAAYAFSRMKFFGREHVLYFYLMFTQVAGGLGIAGLIALYGMLVKLGLYNKLPVLSFIYAAGSVPFNTWLLKGYVDSISPDFDEAALVDGAGYLQIIRYVLLPMALPGIATVAIFAFIGGWTEFILASLLLNQGNQPLSVWIYTLMGGIGRGIQWNYFGAAALLFALPVFVVFMLAQNYIRSGLTIGGLKE